MCCSSATLIIIYVLPLFVNIFLKFFYFLFNPAESMGRYYGNIYNLKNFQQRKSVPYWYFKFACRSNIINELLPFKYPTNSQTDIFGGMLTSMWIWFGHAVASSISIPLRSHNSRNILPTSAFNFPYITCLLYFGANTIWYLQFHLGQFTRNYTQTTKRGLLTTNKGWVSSTGKVRDIQPVLLSGVSKGACPLAHDFARKV